MSVGRERSTRVSAEAVIDSSCLRSFALFTATGVGDDRPLNPKKKN